MWLNVDTKMSVESDNSLQSKEGDMTVVHSQNIPIGLVLAEPIKCALLMGKFTY